MAVDAAVIIPSRYGSTRLPAKPLCEIGGKPMVIRVLEGAAAAGPAVLAVATDHESIAGVVRRAGFDAVMTGDAPSGTARVAEAWRKLGRPCSRIVNLQGDEPFAAASWIEALMSVEPAPDLVATLARPSNPSAASSESSVKVVLDNEGKALYFSRHPIPWGASAHLEHLGVYCFSPGSLESCLSAPPCAAGASERLEQLAWLCAGMRIAVVQGRFEGIGIDTPEDLARAREMLS